MHDTECVSSRKIEGGRLTTEGEKHYKIVVQTDAMINPD